MIPLMSMQNLIPILQIAIGPVILVSGVGLLLLSMTNRFGRVIDRARALNHDRDPAGEIDAHRARIDAQLEILMRRASIVRSAIWLASMSLLLAAVLIIVLFLTALLHLEVALVIISILIACLVALIASLVFFLRDVNLSLVALKLEVEDEAGD
jgi:hypothetical protein